MTVTSGSYLKPTQVRYPGPPLIQTWRLDAVTVTVVDSEEGVTLDAVTR